MKIDYIKADLLNASISLVLIWEISSFFFDHFDPVLFEDTSEQLVAASTECFKGELQATLGR